MGIEPTTETDSARRADGPLDAVSWPVQTQRLTLRSGTEDDVESTWRYRKLEEVDRWLTGGARTLEEYRTKFEDPARLSATIVVALDGEIIGDLMVEIGDAWAQKEVADEAKGVQAELGWVFDPDRAGRGYATEAVREVLRVCFEDLGLRRVVAECFADNEASWRLMERVGMRREAHTIRDSLHRSDGWLDGLSYALLRDEWSSAPRPPAG